VRDAARLAAIFACGVAAVVVGSLAATASEDVLYWLRRHGGESLVLASTCRLMELADGSNAPTPGEGLQV